MRKTNRIGGNLDAHRQTNKEATWIAGKEVPHPLHLRGDHLTLEGGGGERG